MGKVSWSTAPPEWQSGGGAIPQNMDAGQKIRDVPYINWAEKVDIYFILFHYSYLF